MILGIAMASQKPTRLLPPPNTLFIGCSLWVGFLINMLPLNRFLGWLNLLPLILVFWNIHHPRQVGIGIAFFFGILMDIQTGILMGSHALSYTLLTYAAITLRRRFLWFGYKEQILHLCILMCAQQFIFSITLLFSGNTNLGWETLLTPIMQSTLWPLVSTVLQWPQRHIPDSETHHRR